MQRRGNPHPDQTDCPATEPGKATPDPAQFAAGCRVDPRLPELVEGFDAPFFQAGLAGYSDAPMRLIARRLGCPLCVTEALLDRTLLAGGRGFDKADLTQLHDNIPGGSDDHPLTAQLIGSDPDEMADAARALIERNLRPDADDASFQVIDVNLACPVRKIRSKARGGHWLREPQGAIDILRAVRDAVPRSIPTTVKLRRGWDDSAESALSFERIFSAAYELGYAWTTVHCRTVEQKYVGPGDWSALSDLVRRHRDKLIFGSGDIWTASDIFRMLESTGVHAVSVARGCIGNPWIFRQARQMMASQPPAAPTLGEQRQALHDHFALCVAVSGERRASQMMRKFAIRFAAHHPDSELVRQRFIAVKSLEDWTSVLRDHYDRAAVAAAI